MASGSQLTSPINPKLGTSQPIVLKEIPVIVKNNLLFLLRTVKKIEMVTTFGEVLDGLRDYIFQRKLFSPINCQRIICGGDELGSIFGVEEFQISDVKKILPKFLVPVFLKKNIFVDVLKTMPPSVDASAVKRKAEEYQEGGVIKRSCDEQSKEPMFLYIPPSPVKVESSSDSYESVHGYETEFVKDSGDSSYFEDSDNDLMLDNHYKIDKDLIPASLLSDNDLMPGDILAVEETFDVEYDVESDSDEEIKYVTDSCSDSEDGGNTVITFVCKSDSDQEFWADKSSDEEFDSDLEIPESDKWNCKKCGNFNDPPMRYCIKCWSMRSGWVAPKRTERRTKPRRKPRSRKNKNGDNIKKSNKPVDISTKESSSSPKPATSSPSKSAGSPSASISPASEPLKLTDTNVRQEQLSSAADISCSTDLPSSTSNSLPDFPFTSLAPIYPLKYFSISSDIESSSQEMPALSSNSSSQEFPSMSSYNSSQEYSSLSSNSLDVPSTSKQDISSLSNFRTLNLSTVPKCEADSKLCLICCEKPANASIIHGKYAHQISCYRCAKKLWQENKRCPVCRRTIDRVVHQIIPI